MLAQMLPHPNQSNPKLQMFLYTRFQGGTAFPYPTPTQLPPGTYGHMTERWQKEIQSK